MVYICVRFIMYRGISIYLCVFEFASKTTKPESFIQPPIIFIDPGTISQFRLPRRHRVHAAPARGGLLRGQTRRRGVWLPAGAGGG